jgi:hypothetical protein
MNKKITTGFLLIIRIRGIDITGNRDMNGLAEVKGKEIVFLKELQDTVADSDPPAPPGAGPGGPGRGGPEAASTIVEGFSADPKDFNISIENHNTGDGVRLTGDRPLWRINFWSIRNTVCPEAYVEVKADPGKETSWRLTYDFYTVPAGNPGPPRDNKPFTAQEPAFIREECDSPQVVPGYIK